MSNELGTLVARRLSKLGMSYLDLGKLLGYKDGGNITHIVHGRRAIPSHMVEAFAAALQVDPIELLDLLPNDDRYRVIRDKVMQKRAFKDINARQVSMSKYKIPLYTINAGWRSFTAEDPVGYFPLPDILAEQLGGRGVGWIVEGDSMEPVIGNGDIVIGDKDKSFDKGTICICCVCYGESHPDNIATLKAVYPLADGRIRLVPANAEYEPEIVEVEECAHLELWPIVFHVRNYRTCGLKLDRR